MINLPVRDLSAALTIIFGSLVAVSNWNGVVTKTIAGVTESIDPTVIQDLVAANRILADQGIVDGFGHVSVRHPTNANRFLLARSVAPALVTADDIMQYDLDAAPVDDSGRGSYLERFIHSEI